MFKNIIKVEKSPFGHKIIIITIGRFRANIYIYPKDMKKKK